MRPAVLAALLVCLAGAGLAGCYDDSMTPEQTQAVMRQAEKLIREDRVRLRRQYPGVVFVEESTGTTLSMEDGTVWDIIDESGQYTEYFMFRINHMGDRIARFTDPSDGFTFRARLIGSR